MYTFSENVQRSAADLDLASLGSQACEEREREREREGGGGGLKGSAHFALQILVIVEQNNRKCGQKLHTLVWAVAHVTFVAKETRSLKTGRAKPFVWQHSQLCPNDNKQIRILLHKMSWFSLRNKCCRTVGARNRNSRPGTRTNCGACTLGADAET